MGTPILSSQVSMKSDSHVGPCDSGTEEKETRASCLARLSRISTHLCSVRDFSSKVKWLAIVKHT